MLVTDTQPETILKGAQFAARVEEVCRTLPEVRPLPGLKYRRILIPGMIGGETQFALLGFIAHALRMRGAEVTGLCCDEFLPACTMRKADHYESACRRWCYKNSGPFMQAAKLPHRWYSEFITVEEKEACARTASRVLPQELERFEWRGIPLGAHINRSIESYFKVGKFDLDNPAMVAKGREFLTSAMCLTLIGERVLEELKIDKVFVEDGLKIDWGVIRSVARRQGIPVDVCVNGPRGAGFMLEHDRHPEPPEPIPLWPKWRNIPLTESQEGELDEYFAQRATRPYSDQNWTNLAPVEDAAEIRREIGLGSGTSGLVFAMFPNLSCDAAVTSTRPIYDTAAEWVAQTVCFFEQHSRHHLIVKIHPSEKLRQSRDPTMDFLADTFPTLPDNVHVVPPDSRLTAHDVLRVTDIALIYTSTVGVEAAYFGKPVVNVGGGQHAGRGFSIDARTPAEYFETLADICTGRTTPTGQRELARRYAYAAFFRSVLPIRHYTAVFPNITSLNLDTLDDLAPGCDPTMDVICRGVLLDEPFCSEASLWTR